MTLIGWGLENYIYQYFTNLVSIFLSYSYIIMMIERRYLCRIAPALIYIIYDQHKDPGRRW